MRSRVSFAGQAPLVMRISLKATAPTVHLLCTCVDALFHRESISFGIPALREYSTKHACDGRDMICARRGCHQVGIEMQCGEAGRVPQVVRLDRGPSSLDISPSRPPWPWAQIHFGRPSLSSSLCLLAVVEDATFGSGLVLARFEKSWRIHLRIIKTEIVGRAL